MNLRKVTVYIITLIAAAEAYFVKTEEISDPALTASGIESRDVEEMYDPINKQFRRSMQNYPRLSEPFIIDTDENANTNRYKRSEGVSKPFLSESVRESKRDALPPPEKEDPDQAEEGSRKFGPKRKRIVYDEPGMWALGTSRKFGPKVRRSNSVDLKDILADA